MDCSIFSTSSKLSFFHASLLFFLSSFFYLSVVSAKNYSRTNNLLTDSLYPVDEPNYFISIKNYSATINLVMDNFNLADEPNYFINIKNYSATINLVTANFNLAGEPNYFINIKNYSATINLIMANFYLAGEPNYFINIKNYSSLISSQTGIFRNMFLSQGCGFELECASVCDFSKNCNSFGDGIGYSGNSSGNYDAVDSDQLHKKFSSLISSSSSRRKNPVLESDTDHSVRFPLYIVGAVIALFVKWRKNLASNGRYYSENREQIILGVSRAYSALSIYN